MRNNIAAELDEVVSADDTKLVQRLLSHLNKDGPIHPGVSTPCWIWHGHMSRYGYGKIYARGRHWRAHRLIWTLYKGPIPVGLFVCHKCDNPSCCQLDHLFLGTPLDNMKDKCMKGRFYNGIRPRGEAHGPAKLTNDDVATIRNLAASGKTRSYIAQQFGMSISGVNSVVWRRTWRHIP